MFHPFYIKYISKTNPKHDSTMFKLNNTIVVSMRMEDIAQKFTVRLSHPPYCIIRPFDTFKYTIYSLLNTTEF